MVRNAHQLLSAKVYHQRLSPRKNSFCYRTFYTVLDMEKLDEGSNRWFSASQSALLRYRHRDHGERDGSDAAAWAKRCFMENNISVCDLQLITMPRMLGYLFNPVSFWLGFAGGELYGVICEVNNTFRQSHHYLCYREDQQAISTEDWFSAPKEFHVSPFYPREGEYYFKFDLNREAKQYAIIIHYYMNNRLELITSVKGKLKSMTKEHIFLEFLRTPLLTFKVIILIHYQALKLVIKRSNFYSLPKKCAITITKAVNVRKNR